MIKIRFHIILLIIVIAINACAKKTEISKPVKLHNQSTKFLINELESNNWDFTYLFAKFTAHTNINNEKLNFKGSLRIKSDSIIWISFTKLGGVELVRMVLTQDSIKFINKWDKQYYTGKISELSEFGGIDVGYKTLQDLLTGKPFDFNPDDKYKSSNDNSYYLLSLKAKSKFKKTTQMVDEDSLLTIKTKENRYKKVVSKSSDDELMLKRYYLFPESFFLAKQAVNLISQKQAVDIAYNNYQLIDSTYIFALNQTIRIATNEKSSRIDLKFTTISFNEPVNFPFKISKKYVPFEKK